MVFYRLEIKGLGMFCAKGHCSGYAIDILNEIGRNHEAPHTLICDLNFNTKSWFTEMGWKQFEDDIQHLIEELEVTNTPYEVIVSSDLDPMKIHLVDDYQIIEDLNIAIEKVVLTARELDAIKLQHVSGGQTTEDSHIADEKEYVCI